MNLTVKFETAIKLRDAGFPQGKTCFVYAIYGEPVSEHTLFDARKDVRYAKETIDAPTTDELLSSPEIPDDTYITKHIDAKGVHYEVCSASNSLEPVGDIEIPEVVAKYWLKVKEAT